MPRLSDHIENALNEARMLLLGGQVLLGFTYRIFFEPVFERIGPPCPVGVADLGFSYHTSCWPRLLRIIVWLKRARTLSTFTPSPAGC